MPSRKEVYEVIDRERDYQSKWDNERPEGSQKDKDKPVEAWLLWMGEYLDNARKAATTFIDKTDALHHIRKVAALAVACMEYNGAPRRE